MPCNIILQGIPEYHQWPRQESNLDPELRKLIYYPLYYEAILFPRCKGKHLRLFSEFCFRIFTMMMDS